MHVSVFLWHGLNANRCWVPHIISKRLCPLVNHTMSLISVKYNSRIWSIHSLLVFPVPWSAFSCIDTTVSRGISWMLLLTYYGGLRLLQINFLRMTFKCCVERPKHHGVTIGIDQRRHDWQWLIKLEKSWTCTKQMRWIEWSGKSQSIRVLLEGCWDHVLENEWLT